MKITISDSKDSILNYEVPEDAKLAEFGKFKKDLLDALRKGYERGPKSKAFDADEAWRCLSGLARFYLGPASVKQKTMPAWERSERLRDIAKNLCTVRRLVERTMLVDVGGDLYSAWCETNPYFRNDKNDLELIKVFDPVRTKNEFDKVFAGLGTLEAAASRAAGYVPSTKRGTPAILPQDEIWQLANLY